MGHEGFTGTSSLLYHVASADDREVGAARQGDGVRGRSRIRRCGIATSSRHAATKGGSPTLDRIPLLFNQDIAMSYVEPDKQDEHFYRNAQADELVYVAKGRGRSRRCSATCRSGRATTSSSTAAFCTATSSTRRASSRSCS